MTLISHFDFFVSFVLLLSLFVYIEEQTHVQDLGHFCVRVYIVKTRKGISGYCRGGMKERC